MPLLLPSIKKSDLSLRGLLSVWVLFFGLMVSAQQSSPDIYERYNIYRNPTMVFLNKFSLTLSAGYGNTNYRHDLENVYFFQDETRQLILSNDIEALPPQFSGFSDWLYDPMQSDTILNNSFFDVPYNYLENPVFNDTLRRQTLLLDTDTAQLSFSSIAHSIPVQFTIHYNYQAFRFGFGFNWERQYVKDFEPSILTTEIRPYNPNFKKTSYTRFFGMVGYRFYEYWDYTFAGEVEFGVINAGKQFNENLITRGVYTTVGVNIEQNWSEYFRIIVKPSYEFKTYTVSLPDGSASVRHNHNAFFIRVGISINIPEIPRSPMDADHVQLKHVITDPASGRLMEVRGQPIWKKQNPKVGENHRKLWRYKQRNKRKLNPY